MDVPQARRLERASWINGRTLLGLLIFAAALFGGQRVMQNAENTVTVWTAARDVPGGEVIDRTHLRVAEVRLPSDLLASYALASTPLEGTVATRPIAAGELFSTAWIADGTELDSGRVISIPLQPEHAVGGTLSPGDRIDILATFDAGEARARNGRPRTGRRSPGGSASGRSHRRPGSDRSDGVGGRSPVCAARVRDPER